MRHPFTLLTVLLLVPLAALCAAAPEDKAMPIPVGLEVGQLPLRFQESVKADAPDKIVSDVWERSKKIRAQNLAAELKQKKPGGGPWLFDWWLSALHQQYRLPEANAFMRESATDRVEGTANSYLYLMFGREGKYPNRLEPQTLTVLKERLWKEINYWLDPAGPFQTQASSENGTKYDLFPLKWGRMWGNENMEVRRKLPTYLALYILAADPAYANREIGGKTIAQWLPIMQAHVKDIIRERALYGLWAEPGSTYTELTYEFMLMLHDVAPDPELRQLAKMFLDLIFIEEAQFSVNGIRGGGKSRAAVPEHQKHLGIKNVAYGIDAGAGGRSTVLELSDYQVPPAAILLYYSTGAEKPFAIYDRVPGEQQVKGEYTPASQLISYAYRTPYYLLGCSMKNPNLHYHPTSDQTRWSGILFEAGGNAYPAPSEVPHKSGSGRSGNAYWSVQNDNVMMLQKLKASDYVENIQAFFSKELKVTERDGWIFTQSGKGYLAVAFIDPQSPTRLGKYQATATAKTNKGRIGEGKLFTPVRDFMPLVFHAGDADTHGSFEDFQKTILAGILQVNAQKSEVEYRPKGGAVITWAYDCKANPLPMPRVNGQRVNLEPELTFNSPFLKARWGDRRIYAGVGPYRSVYDFATNQVHSWVTDK
jgi:hypothetical protein